MSLKRYLAADHEPSSRQSSSWSQISGSLSETVFHGAMAR
jgi:hypothetical protein